MPEVRRCPFIPRPFCNLSFPSQLCPPPSSPFQVPLFTIYFVRDSPFNFNFTSSLHPSGLFHPPGSSGGKSSSSLRFSSKVSASVNPSFHCAHSSVHLMLYCRRIGILGLSHRWRVPGVRESCLHLFLQSAVQYWKASCDMYF